MGDGGGGLVAVQDHAIVSFISTSPRSLQISWLALLNDKRRLKLKLRGAGLRLACRSAPYLTEEVSQTVASLTVDTRHHPS